MINVTKVSWDTFKVLATAPNILSFAPKIYAYTEYGVYRVIINVSGEIFSSSAVSSEEQKEFETEYLKNAIGVTSNNDAIALAFVSREPIIETPIEISNK